MPALSARAQGYLYAFAAPVCWSAGGVVMRTVEAGPWEIVFWRALAHTAVFPLVLVFVLRVNPLRGFRDMPGVMIVSALMVTGTFVLHVIGMTSTTIANALLLQSVSPLIVAIFARVFLKEAVSTASWIAIAVAFAGLSMVMGASFDDGAIVGQLAAIAVAIVSAVNVTLIRRTRTLDFRPATVLAALFAGAIGFFAGNPATTSFGDAVALMALGLAQMTIGLMFFYSALKRLDPVSVTLIALIEPILGPIWTWLAVGEEPSQGTLIGGAVLLGALVFNTLATVRARSTA